MLKVNMIPLQSEIRFGEEGIWQILLNNDSWWVSLDCHLLGKIENTFYGFGGDIQLDMPVSMRGTESVKLPFVSDYSGQLRLQFMRLEYMDLLGLFRISRVVQVQSEIMAMPRENEETIDRKSGYQAGVRDAEESTAKGNDFAEVTDMREYRPGDRLKDIHWKLSAKKEVLMVKERTSMAQSEVVMLLDLTSDRDRTEQILTLAYSVSKAFLEEYIPVRLLWWDAQMFDFQETFISDFGGLDQGFCVLLRGRMSREKQDVVSLMRRLHPEIHAFVFLHEKAGETQGEVVFHG